MLQNMNRKPIESFFSSKKENEEEEVEIKFLRGKKGDKGDEPSNERLKELIVPLIPELVQTKDGEKLTKKQLKEMILPLIPEPVKGESGSPDTGTEIIEKINSEKKGIIKKERVEGWTDLESNLLTNNKKFQKMLSFGGANAINIKNNGVVVGQVQTINIIGATITSVGNGGEINVAFSSSGLAVIAVSGTINDSNKTFTSATQPTLLNINGSFYQMTGGNITWSYTTGTITLSAAVGTGGSIFGI